MDLDQIEKLNDLKLRGLISEEEYQQAKERILGASTTSAQSVANMSNYDYAMVLHLTQLCLFFLPLVGILIPLVMWQTRKEDPYVDQQGRVVMNWVFSWLIYTAIGFVLIFILIGFVLLPLLAICAIVFIIMGAMDANKGVIKNYPLAIKFFDVRETPRAPVVQN